MNIHISLLFVTEVTPSLNLTEEQHRRHTYLSSVGTIKYLNYFSWQEPADPDHFKSDRLFYFLLCM